MVQRGMKVMMAFLMEGDFWLNQSEEPLRRRMLRHSSVPEHTTKGNGWFDVNERGDRKNLYDNEDIGASYFSKLLPPTTLNTENPIHLVPSDESTSLSDNAGKKHYTPSYETAERTEGFDFSLLRLPYFQRNLHQSKSCAENTHTAQIFGIENIQTVSISSGTLPAYRSCGFCLFTEISGREKKQDHDYFELSDSYQKSSSLKVLPRDATLAASAAQLENPHRPVSTSLESGLSQEFIEDLKEALAYALQVESERGTCFLVVADFLDWLILQMIKGARKDQQTAASGTKTTRISVDMSPEFYKFSYIWGAFLWQFNEIFKRALTKERDFKKAFPGASTNLQIQVVGLLRKLRQAAISIPDWVARHEKLMSSIRLRKLKLDRPCGTKNVLVSRKRKREEGARGSKGSLRLRRSSRHCEWCSWRLYTRLEPECEVCT